ncbi:DMT family transporter [Bradyrhizobium sp. HKCCYLR20261]|uniref:DMT family transporter n=1 Tax=Bradyrhizobium sp. HKCCYLR20261 TaxID=3420760 RepID=UPI003EBD183D
MSPLETVCAVLVPFLWGMQYAIIKEGLAVFPPLFFVGLRFAMVAAILLPLVGRPTRRELGLFLLISIFIGGLNFGLVFAGLTRAPASVTGIANQLWTPLTLLLAWPLLGERPSRLALLGVTMALGGVAIAIGDPAGAVPLVPTLYVVGSAAALALGTVLSKRYGPFEPMKQMAWISLFTVPQVLAVSALVETGQASALSAANTAAWLALCYTISLGGIVGFGLWFWLVSRCSIARVAPYTLLQSPFAIAAGVLFKHEALTPAVVAGALICIAGVAITQRQGSGQPSGNPRGSLTPARRRP